MNEIQFLNLKKAHDDPVWYVENVLGVEDIEDYQKDVLYSVRDNIKTAFRSGHGVGKTAVAAWIINWFFDTRPDSKVITTASSWRQVSKMLWPEIHKWRSKADLEKIGVYEKDYESLTLMLKRTDQQDWFATGEASDDHEKMEGFHADNILYVIDECKAVPDKTFEAVEGASTNAEGEVRILAISTPPPEKVGYFYDIFAGKRIGWKKFHISGLDSKRVSKAWIEERASEWGRDSTIFKNRVLGEFGDHDDDTLIHLSWIESCVNKQVIEEGDTVGGCDVARFGDDKTTIQIKKGQKAYPCREYAKEDTMQIAGRLINDLKSDVKWFNVDDIGVGGGVVDRCKELKHDVRGVNVGEKANDSEKFKNLRAELWWNLRERFRTGDISIPDDEILIAQLSTIKYKYNSRGQIQIESKEDLKKRGLKSPDRADALCLAFMPDNSSGLLDYYKEQHGTNNIREDNKQVFSTADFLQNNAGNIHQLRED